LGWRRKRDALRSQSQAILPKAKDGTPKELVQFLFHVRGSLLELQTQITVAERFGYLSESDAIDIDLERRSARVGRLLNG
jgi:four helix bundle protein